MRDGLRACWGEEMNIVEIVLAVLVAILILLYIEPKLPASFESGEEDMH